MKPSDPKTTRAIWPAFPEDEESQERFFTEYQIDIAVQRIYPINVGKQFLFVASGPRKAALGVLRESQALFFSFHLVVIAPLIVLRNGKTALFKYLIVETDLYLIYFSNP